VPRSGRLVVNSADQNLQQVLSMGCWTPVDEFSGAPGVVQGWHLQADEASGYSSFEIFENRRRVGEVRWDLLGRHNAENALAAFLASRHAGVSEEAAVEALCRFGGVRRRLEVRGTVDGVVVYDDFAHHPTAIRHTLEGVRRKAAAGRVVAVLEPRSNTMKQGTHKAELVDSLRIADRAYLYQSPEVKWNVAESMRSLDNLAVVEKDINRLAASLAKDARAGDHFVLMSNGSFGGLHEKLLEALASRAGNQGGLKPND
jgi:UDP-N-acetylmuramate: L-alanyl-gamma-D-glutamyl-meso-diaminopimelate ligase